jgi:hypothetical protein
MAILERIEQSLADPKTAAAAELAFYAGSTLAEVDGSREAEMQERRAAYGVFC